MTTPTHFITEIAAATGIPEAKVAYYAKVLRGESLFTKGGKGGGKNAGTVAPGEAINLVLALLSAETATEAPEIVRRLRVMAPFSEGEIIHSQVGNISSTTMQSRLIGSFLTGPGTPVLWPGATFAEALICGVAAAAGRMMGHPSGEICIEKLTVWRGKFHASIDIEGGKYQSFSEPVSPTPEQYALALRGDADAKPAIASANPRAPMTVPASFGGEIFGVLAGLLVETVQGGLPLEQPAEKQNGPEVVASEPFNEGGSDMPARAIKTGASAQHSRKPAILESAKQAERENDNPRVRPSTRREKGSRHASNHPPVPNVA
jgi:hypothetical protein